MIGYLKQQVDEIAGDPALRAYGVALLATHVLTAFWLLNSGQADIVAAGQEAICWPLVPDCEALRVFSAAALQPIFAAYGVAALALCAAFARKNSTAIGWAGLLCLTVFKLAVIALDFRLRLNQHYMAFAVTGVFLLIPRKRESLQLLIVLFYFWAGTLKLNSDWLSGAALYHPLWLISGRAVILACAYVVALELVIVWGLLARRRGIFWTSFAQVLLFHVMSWAVVGFYYPILMFMLLAIFPLARRSPSVGEGGSVFEALSAVRRAWPAWLVAGLFSLVQLSTHLYPGDTAITGEGRLFALHMFDARIVCEATATATFPDGSREIVDLNIGSARTGCDPITVHGYARILCRRRESGVAAFDRLDLKLLARRATESELRPVVQIDDFCTKQPRYSPFLHNDWIATR